MLADPQLAAERLVPGIAQPLPGFGVQEALVVAGALLTGTGDHVNDRPGRGSRGRVRPGGQAHEPHRPVVAVIEPQMEPGGGPLEHQLLGARRRGFRCHALLRSSQEYVHRRTGDAFHHLGKRRGPGSRAREDAGPLRQNPIRSMRAARARQRLRELGCSHRMIVARPRFVLVSQNHPVVVDYHPDMLRPTQLRNDAIACAATRSACWGR